jgi:hypothetical protein
MGKLIGKIAGWMVGISIANGMAFLIGTAILGGDSAPRKPGETGYYVSNHGRRTEVSALAWHYSFYHKVTVLITIPPVMLGGIVLVWRQSLNQMRERSDDSQ